MSVPASSQPTGIKPVVRAKSRAQLFWERRARRVCLKHNTAIWLAGWLPVILATAVFASCAILALRRQEAGLGSVWVGAAASGGIGALVVFALRRKNFFNGIDGLVRLDAAHRLHNRLTAAAAGVGDWPEPVLAAGDRWRWRGVRVASQLIGAAVLVAAATVIPLPAASSTPAKPQVPPSAWAEVESWIDTLKKEDVVQADSLQNLREQLDSLRRQDPESWYDHASLEAGDSLRSETAQAIRDLQQNLQASADQASKLLASSDQGLSDHDLLTMSQAISGALQNLASGRLPLNAELLKKLQKMDPKSLKSMSPEQLAQLQEQLQQGCSACKKCLADGKEGEMMTLQEGRAKNGGLGGGGDTAPLTAKNPTNLHTKTTDTMSNDDLTRALPGEIVAMSTGEHQVEKTSAAPAAGGQVASPGQGGEAVARDSLTPKEREAVAKFFQ